MAWQVSGRSLDLCSCKMWCPCWLGPEIEPDEGWCAHTFGFEIRQGNADGIDLSGTIVAFTGEWPANFFLGGGRARLYLDKTATEEQQRELETIFNGTKSGHLQSLWDATIVEWLPAIVASITISWGEKPTLSVDGFGQATMQPLSDGAGKSTIVSGAMSQAGLQIDNMNLASSQGSHWSDPDFRSWEGNSGNIHEFDWRN
ncbi:MAG: DUF1326 domain-containing protein [Proteobacteria bacterium]|nr:DUF1326 domain-containing protein [Pseudomonadota bacterium]